MPDKFIEITSDTLAAGAPIAMGALIGGSVGVIPAAILSSVVKMGAQTCMNKIYDDLTCRQLSSLQLNRVEQVLYHAQRAYYEQIERQGWVLTHPESDAYVQAHMEVCEHTVINAINETQSKKIPFEGYLFASKYNSTQMAFDDFHMMASILLKMTWRELVLVQLFCEGWSVEQKELSITNPAACVEIYDLVTWGLVKPEEGWVIENNSAPVQISNISVTEFGSLFSSSLQTEKISQEDKLGVIQSLRLQKIEGQERINRSHALEWEDFDDVKDTMINEVEQRAKEREYKEKDQAMFDYDVARGK